jgi:hypothetical protein
VWQFAKHLVFGHGSRPRTIWFGPGAGCRLVIDPAEKSQRIVGLDEAEIAGVFRRSISGTRTFIDIGASDGYYPLIALRLNPSLTAIGCEPQVHFEQRAWENYRLNFQNNVSRMVWVPKLVGSGQEHTSLDRLAEGRPGPFLVKIDVDGAEIDVLRSGPTLLSRSDCRVLLEVHSHDLEATSMRLLESYGFTCRIVKNAWWRSIVPETRVIELNRWLFADKPNAEPNAAPARY